MNFRVKKKAQYEGVNMLMASTQKFSVDIGAVRSIIDNFDKGHPVLLIIKLQVYIYIY